ncbi:alpha-ketoglutarate-dependent dioxygenase alkB isoform X4 [Gossypium arboreum]|uniref:alpha-ketoglutarate-dependent dioxygenase alkB isoform X4 n=1 Tax=Gossypium arboreum TaxID=29729 RepID=UPI00081944B6|nr:alpha-ketoglutarate-dependent dioxygenase alkB isoform X4 [Gossypium arboreum]
MYGSDRAGDDAERTAFRKTEKKYKLYYENSKSTKKKKQPKQVDLSEVLDFKSISESFNQNVELPPGVVHVNCGFDRPIFGLENSPAKEGKVFIEEETSDNGLDSEPSASVSNGDSHRWKFYEEDIARSRGKACKTVPASVLLRKLRWSTLGLQFDWSNRNYAVSLPHNKIPNALCQLAKRMAEPAMPIGEEFRPEAAIVNYFGSGDTLGGHLDDMEADWSKPIVSMSFGCKAIFLLGGKSRQDEPLAMFLRSGDVVLMAGEARECFHGVPRIFTDEENAEITPLELRFSDEDDRCFLDYIRTSRININIRQVF